MATLLSTFSLLHLGALAFAAFAPLLIFAYRRRDKKQITTVSSLLCFRSLKKAELPKAKIKLPPRFFVELFALLIIVIASSLPFFKESGERIVILIDNSLSMSAKFGEHTRWEEAKIKLQRWTENNKQSGSYILFTTSPSVTQHGEGGLSRNSLLGELDRLEFVAAEDKLESAVEQISNLASFEKIVIVSDKKINSAQRDLKVEEIFVGGEISNLFIKSASLSEKGGRKIIISEIASSSNKTLTFELALSGSIFNKDSDREIELYSSQFQVEANNIKSVELPLPSQLSGLNIFRLEIKSLDDHVPLDNTAWLSLSQSQLNSILLVTDQKSSDALGLAKIPMMEVRVISAEQFSQLSAQEIEKYRALILHRVTLPQVYRIPTISILPPANDRFFRQANLLQSIEITSWIDHHPLLAYLQVPLLSGGSGVTFVSQPWLRPVVNVSTGAIVVAGESEGIRFLGFGVELLPFEGSKEPAVSILTLNALNWIAKERSASAIVVGDTVNLEQFTSAQVVDPRGERLETTANKTFVANLTGPYAIVTEEGEEFFTVNSYFPTESNSNKIDVVTINVATSRDVQKFLESSTPVWPFIVAAVILLLTIEYLLRVREIAKSAEVVAK